MLRYISISDNSAWTGFEPASPKTLVFKTSAIPFCHHAWVLLKNLNECIYYTIKCYNQ